MTVTADAKQRIVIPGSKPGERFDVQFPAADKVVLVRLQGKEAEPAPVRIEKRGGFSVGVTSHTVDEAALKESLADLP